VKEASKREMYCCKIQGVDVEDSEEFALQGHERDDSMILSELEEAGRESRESPQKIQIRRILCEFRLR
jgi:hypothetical protein